MKPPRLNPFRLLASAFALVLLTAARAEEVGNSIKFSDPSKPGTVKIIVGRGDLRVQGADAAEVTVKSEAKAVTKTPRKDGLRVLTASSSFALSEKENVITLDALSEGWGGGGSDFRLTVPRSTSIVVQNSWSGNITCTEINGDVEIHSMNGEIRLNEVAGGVVVDTTNGEIRASIRELHENKPLSFQSMNGEVVLRLPSDTKANVRLRTQNGAVLTDFPETALITKTENTPSVSSSRRGKTLTLNGKNVFPPEAQDAIRDAARAGVQAMHEAAQAIKDGVEDAHEKISAARERAEAAREKAQADRENVEAARAPRAPRPPKPVTAAGMASPADVAPVPPVPPVPSIPTITGGKLVTGTLNGGGPEISVATMNGDVTLRQLEKK